MADLGEHPGVGITSGGLDQGEISRQMSLHQFLELLNILNSDADIYIIVPGDESAVAHRAQDTARQQVVSQAELLAQFLNKCQGFPALCLVGFQGDFFLGGQAHADIVMETVFVIAVGFFQIFAVIGGSGIAVDHDGLAIPIGSLHGENQLVTVKKLHLLPCRLGGPGGGQPGNFLQIHSLHGHLWISQGFRERLQTVGAEQGLPGQMPGHGADFRPLLQNFSDHHALPPFSRYSRVRSVA